MRLAVLDTGHRLPARLFMAMVARRSGVELADVARTLLYRPDFFGGPMLHLTAEVMRGPSYWTAGEREYLALFTAQLHRCRYGIESHAELTRLAAHGEIDPADPGSARVEVAAILPFLEKVTRTPDTVSEQDLGCVRGVGIANPGIAEALHVNLVWNIVNRLAHAFGFRLRDGQLAAGTRSLHRFGYRFPGFLIGRDGSDRAGNRYGALVTALRRAVFTGPARTAPATRSAAGDGTGLPELWQPYVGKVRDRADQVTDADVASLRAAGHSEDEIFELTVAAAVGAALRGLDAGLRAVGLPVANLP